MNREVLRAIGNILDTLGDMDGDANDAPPVRRNRILERTEEIRGQLARINMEVNHGNGEFGL